MPKLKYALPKYRKHKANGNAVILGRALADVSQVDAERDASRAMEIARQVG